MKLLTLSLGVICCLMLTACGDNWLAGGASLGGTGGSKPSTGTGVDENPDSPLPHIEPPITEKEVFKYIVYHPPLTDYCGALQRKIYFVDGDGQSVLKDQQEVFSTAVALRIELTNTASYPVYEKLAECEAPIKLLTVNPSTNEKEAIKPVRTTQCSSAVAWRVYQPNKTEVYNFTAGDMALSEDITEGEIAHYYIEYSPSYVQRALTGLPSENDDVLSCEPLGLYFNTVNKRVATAGLEDSDPAE